MTSKERVLAIESNGPDEIFDPVESISTRPSVMQGVPLVVDIAKLFPDGDLVGMHIKLRG